MAAVDEGQDPLVGGGWDGGGGGGIWNGMRTGATQGQQRGTVGWAIEPNQAGFRKVVRQVPRQRETRRTTQRKKRKKDTG